MVLTVGRVAQLPRLTAVILWAHPPSRSVAWRNAARQVKPQAAQRTEQCALAAHIAGLGFRV